jgi:hypothetical protein
MLYNHQHLTLDNHIHTREPSGRSIFLPILRVPPVNFQNLPSMKKAESRQGRYIIYDYPVSGPRWTESRQGRYIIYDYLVSDPKWAESRQGRCIIYDYLVSDPKIFGWRFGLITGDFFIDVFDACFYCLLMFSLFVSVLNQLHPISIYIVYISVLLVVFHMRSLVLYYFLIKINLIFWMQAWYPELICGFWTGVVELIWFESFCYHFKC